MRKLAAAIAIVGVLASSTVPADAQQHNRHHGGGGHHHRGGGSGWVAPVLGGMLLGGAIYGLSQQPTYAAPGVYINPQFREPRPQYRRECQYVPSYDVYGNYYGERLECFNVPNY